MSVVVIGFQMQSDWLAYNEYTTWRDIYVGVTCGQLDMRSFLNIFHPYLVPILFHWSVIPTFSKIFFLLICMQGIIIMWLCIRKLTFLHKMLFRFIHRFTHVGCYLEFYGFLVLFIIMKINLRALIWCISEVCTSFIFQVISVCIQAVENLSCVIWTQYNV